VDIIVQEVLGHLGGAAHDDIAVLAVQSTG
jgi:hypothetical protein